MPDYSYQDSLAGEEGGFGDPQGPPPSDWETDWAEVKAQEDRGETDPVRPYLPKPRRQPETVTIRSSDLEHTICVHELAFGIAIASGADPAADEVPAAITQFAHRVLEWIDLTPPCEHKEAR